MKVLFNSFKYSGISCLLDGNEDDMFRGYEDEETEVKQQKLRMNKDQEHEYITSISSTD